MTMADAILNIELCLEVEKHPCLYDVSLDDHSKRHILEKAWADVGEKMDLSGEACRKRWANLRTVYVRKRSKAKSGSGLKKEYYLSKYMHFLTPHIKLPIESTGANVVSSECGRCNDQPLTSEGRSESHPILDLVGNDSNNELFTEDIRDDNQVNTNQFSSIQFHKKVTTSNEVREESYNDNNGFNKPSSNNQPHKKLTKHTHEVREDSHNGNTSLNKQSSNHQGNRKVIKPMSKIDEVVVDYFQSKKQKLSADPEDPRRCFLISLLPEVKELSEAKFKTFKRQVLALLDELDITRPTTPLSIPSYTGCRLDSQVSSPLLIKVEETELSE